MNKKTLTIAIILLLIASVFAAPSSPSVSIIQPNGGEIINRDFNIAFAINDYSSVTSTQLTLRNADSSFNTQIMIDNNFSDENITICNTYNLALDPVCYFEADSTLFSDGNYKIKVSAQGTSNEDDLSDASFIIDNTPPVIDFNFPTQSGWINSDKNFLKASIVDATSGVDANTIVARLNGTDYNINNRVFFAGGVMDFNLIDLGLVNGNDYNIFIDANDLARNEATQFVYTIKIDTNNPTLIDVNTPTKTNDITPEIITNATDAESGLTNLMLSCDGINWTSVAYTSNYSGFDISLCSPGDGDKNVFIKVSDNVGNESGVIVKTIILDKTSPTITITKTPDTNSWTSSTVSVDLNCFDEKGKISYWLNKNYNFVDSNFVNFLISNDGNNELIYSCFDDLNNSDGNHFSYIAIDKTTPKVNFSLKTAQKDINVSLDWSDVNKLSDVNYFIWKKENNESYFDLLIGPMTDSNYIDSNTQVDKNYCYFIQTINELGNDSNSSTYCIIIDQNKPIIDSGKPSASVNNNNVNISFTASDVNGSGVKGYYVSKDKNTWYYTTSNSYPFNNLANGTYTFYVIAVDFADNNSDDKNVSATINYTAPNNNRESERALSPTTGAFGLIDTLRGITFPIILLLLLLIIVLVFFGGKKKRTQSQAGHGRHFMENDISDFEVNKWSGKWEFEEEK